MKIKRFVVGSLLCGLCVTASAQTHKSATNAFKAAAKDTKPAKTTFKAAVKINPTKPEDKVAKDAIKSKAIEQPVPAAASEKAPATSDAFSKAAARVNVVVAERKKPTQVRIPFARPEENVTQIMAGDPKQNELFIFGEKDTIPEDLVEVYPDASMAALGGDEKIAVEKVNEFKKTLEKVGHERIIAAQQARVDDAFLKAFSADLNLALNPEKYNQRFEIKVKSNLDPELQAVKPIVAETHVKTTDAEIPVKPIFASKQSDFEVTHLELPVIADHLKKQAFNIKPKVSVDSMLASLNQPVQPIQTAKPTAKPTVVAYQVQRDDRNNLADAEAVKKTVAQFSRNYCELNINLYLSFHKPPTHPVFSPEAIQQKFVAMGPKVGNAFADTVNADLSYTLQALAENKKLFAIPVQERQINTALIHRKLDALRTGLNKTQKDQFDLAVNAPLSETLKSVAENKETLAVIHVAQAFHEGAKVAANTPAITPPVVSSSALLADNSKIANSNAKLHAALKMNDAQQEMPPVVIADNKPAKASKTFIPKEVSLDDLPKPKKMAKSHTPSADSQRLSKEVLAARERALQKLEKQLAEDAPEPVVISNQAYHDESERPQPQKKKEVFAEREQPRQVAKHPTREEDEMPPAPKQQVQADAYPGFEEEGDAFPMMNENDKRMAKHGKSSKGKEFDEDMQAEMKSNTDWGDFGEVDSPSNFAAYDDSAASDDEAFDKSLAMRESSEFSRLMEE